MRRASALGRVDPPVLVDPVALGLEQRGLGRGVGAVEAAVGGEDAPPRQVRDGPQDVGDGLAAARTSELHGQLAVGDEVAPAQVSDGLDDGALEGRRLVVLGPGGGVGRGQRGDASSVPGPG